MCAPKRAKAENWQFLETTSVNPLLINGKRRETSKSSRQRVCILCPETGKAGNRRIIETTSVNPLPRNGQRRGTNISSRLRVLNLCPGRRRGGELAIPRDYECESFDLKRAKAGIWNYGDYECESFAPKRAKAGIWQFLETTSVNH